MTEYQWKTVSVVGFDELMQALDRADRKGYMPDAIKDEWEAFNWKPAQPEQEPVEYWTVANGWVSEQAEVPAAVWVEPDFWEHCNRVNCGTAYRLPAPGRQPLYASPPAQRKPWVGLTPEQRATIAEANNMLVDDDLFDAIEAELKEKNT